MNASNDRKTRCQRREELREKWLAKQEADKEARVLRKADAEKRGIKWLRERAAWLTLQSAMRRQNFVGALHDNDLFELRRLFPYATLGERGCSMPSSSSLALAADACCSYNRRPLGQWTKGKVWSDAAETYV